MCETENYTAVVKGNIPKSLKLNFKVLCVQKDVTMSSVLEELIDKWIQENAPTYMDIIDFDDEALEEVKGYIPKSLKLQFKKMCIRKRIDIKFVLYELIQEWIRVNKL